MRATHHLSYLALQAPLDSYRPPPGPLSVRASHDAPRLTLWPWIVALVVLALAWWFRDLLTLVGAAFAAAWFFSPAVDWLVERRVPRPAAIAIVLLGAGLFTTTLLWIAVPDIIEHVSALLATVPRRIQQDWLPRISSALLYVRRRFHLRIPVTADAWLSQLAERASSVAQGSLSVVASAANASLSIVEFAVDVLIVMAISFYALSSWNSITNGVYDLVPVRARAATLRIAKNIDHALGRFVRGQFLVMLILGTLFSVGLSALKLPAGVGLGIFAGLIAFVPYLGFFIALGFATLLAALDTTGQCSVLGVVIFMLIVHLLDILVVTPRVLGGSIGLSPMVVIVALLAGAKVLGFLGLLVAVPVAAVLKVLLDEGVDWYKSTRFYAAPPAHTLDAETLANMEAPAPRLTMPPKGDQELL